LQRTGGSQLSLLRALSMIGPPATPVGGVFDADVELSRDQLRQQQFFVASRLADRVGESTTIIEAMRELPTDPGELEMIQCLQMKGIRQVVPADSLILFSTPDGFRLGRDWVGPLEQEAEQSIEHGRYIRVGASLWEDYSTLTGPTSERDSAEWGVIHHWDLSDADNSSISFTLGSHMSPSQPDPRVASDDPGSRFILTSCAVATPIAKLTLELYLHEDLARECKVVSSFRHGHYHLTPGAAELPSRDTPPLQLVREGRTLADLGTDESARLTRKLFEDSGWDITRFAHYRLEVEYPIWNCTYKIEAEFDPRS